MSGMHPADIMAADRCIQAMKQTPERHSLVKHLSYLELKRRKTPADGAYTILIG